MSKYFACFDKQLIRFKNVCGTVLLNELNCIMFLLNNIADFIAAKTSQKNKLSLLAKTSFGLLAMAFALGKCDMYSIMVFCDFNKV